MIIQVLLCPHCQGRRCHWGTGSPEQPPNCCVLPCSGGLAGRHANRVANSSLIDRATCADAHQATRAGKFGGCFTD